MFKTRKKFENKVMNKVVKSGEYWYCFYADTCRQGKTKEQAIKNAYELWKGKGKNYGKAGS